MFRWSISKLPKPRDVFYYCEIRCIVLHNVRITLDASMFDMRRTPFTPLLHKCLWCCWNIIPWHECPNGPIFFSTNGWAVVDFSTNSNVCVNLNFALQNSIKMTLQIRQSFIFVSKKVMQFIQFQTVDYILINYKLWYWLQLQSNLFGRNTVKPPNMTQNSWPSTIWI